MYGARGRSRTCTEVTSRWILSPLRLPISPPGHGYIRLGPESNRCSRLCMPLHNHSATQPCLERETRLELATPTLARLCSTTELFPHKFYYYFIIFKVKKSFT